MSSAETWPWDRAWAHAPLGTVLALGVGMLDAHSRTRLYRALNRHLPVKPDRLPWRGMEDDTVTQAVLSHDGDLTVSATRWQPDEGSFLLGYEHTGGVVQLVSGMIEIERFVPRSDRYEFDLFHLRPGGRALLPAGGYWRIESVTRSVTIQAEYPAVTALEPAVVARLVESRRVRPRRRSIGEWLELLRERNGLTAA